MDLSALSYDTDTLLTGALLVMNFVVVVAVIREVIALFKLKRQDPSYRD